MKILYKCIVLISLATILFAQEVRPTVNRVMGCTYVNDINLNEVKFGLDGTTYSEDSWVPALLRVVTEDRQSTISVDVDYSGRNWAFADDKLGKISYGMYNRYCLTEHALPQVTISNLMPEGMNYFEQRTRIHLGVSPTISGNQDIAEVQLFRRDTYVRNGIQVGMPTKLIAVFDKDNFDYYDLLGAEDGTYQYIARAINKYDGVGMAYFSGAFTLLTTSNRITHEFILPNYSNHLSSEMMPLDICGYASILNNCRRDTTYEYKTFNNTGLLQATTSSTKNGYIVRIIDIRVGVVTENISTQNVSLNTTVTVPQVCINNSIPSSFNYKLQFLINASGKSYEYETPLMYWPKSVSILCLNTVFKEMGCTFNVSVSQESLNCKGYYQFPKESNGAVLFHDTTDKNPYYTSGFQDNFGQYEYIPTITYRQSTLPKLLTWGTNFPYTNDVAHQYIIALYYSATPNESIDKCLKLYEKTYLPDDLWNLKYVTNYIPDWGYIQLHELAMPDTGYYYIDIYNTVEGATAETRHYLGEIQLKNWRQYFKIRKEFPLVVPSGNSGQKTIYSALTFHVNFPAKDDYSNIVPGFNYKKASELFSFITSRGVTPYNKYEHAISYSGDKVPILLHYNLGTGGTWSSKENLVTKKDTVNKVIYFKAQAFEVENFGLFVCDDTTPPTVSVLFDGQDYALSANALQNYIVTKSYGERIIEDCGDLSHWAARMWWDTGYTTDTGDMTGALSLITVNVTSYIHYAPPAYNLPSNCFYITLNESIDMRDRKLSFCLKAVTVNNNNISLRYSVKGIPNDNENVSYGLTRPFVLGIVSGNQYVELTVSPSYSKSEGGITSLIDYAPSNIRNINLNLSGDGANEYYFDNVKLKGLLQSYIPTINVDITDNIALKQVNVYVTNKNDGASVYTTSRILDPQTTGDDYEKGYHKKINIVLPVGSPYAGKIQTYGVQVIATDMSGNQQVYNSPWFDCIIPTSSEAQYQLYAPPSSANAQGLAIVQIVSKNSVPTFNFYQNVISDIVKFTVPTASLSFPVFEYTLHYQQDTVVTPQLYICPLDENKWQLNSYYTIVSRNYEQGTVTFRSAMPGYYALFDTTDNVPPTVDILVNGSTIIRDVYTNTLPEVASVISDNIGLAAYSLSVVNAVTSESAYTTTVTLNNPDVAYSAKDLQQTAKPEAKIQGSNQQKTMSVFSANEDASYIVQVSALDVAGNTITRMSSPFRIMFSSGVGDFVYGPNPFDPGKENFQIVLGLEQETDVVITIYTVAGEKIWKYEGTHTGNTKILWDGHNLHGELVANGAYLCFMKVTPKSGGSTERKKFTIAVLK